jgi:hypothetical protein
MGLVDDMYQAQLKLHILIVSSVLGTALLVAPTFGPSGEAGGLEAPAMSAGPKLLMPLGVMLHFHDIIG